MKLTLHLKNWSAIELQGSPVDCAIFLNALRGELSQPIKNDTVEDAPSAAPPKTRETTADRRSRTIPGNRRQRVLHVLQEMAQAGEDTVRLNQITDRYGQTFPGEDLRHLDQVVRDLANKTELVESPQRGYYRLTESSPSQRVL